MARPAPVVLSSYRFWRLLGAGETRTICQRFELAGRVGALSVPAQIPGLDVVARKLRRGGTLTPIPLTGITPVDAGDQLELTVSNTTGDAELFEAFVSFALP